MTRERAAGVGWFAAWAVTGAAAVTGVLAAFALPVALGMFVLAGALAAWLQSRPAARGWIAGAISGAGLPLIYIAYLNRDGPGDVCLAHDAGACTRSAEEWSPWPFLVVAGLLVACGILVSARSRPR